MMSQGVPLPVKFAMRGDAEVRDGSAEDLPLDFSARKSTDNAVNLSMKAEWSCESDESVPSGPEYNAVSPLMCMPQKQSEPLLGLGLFNNFMQAAPPPAPVQSSLMQVPSKGKASRPFKAYPKDPLSLPVGLGGLAVGVSTAEAFISQASNQAYSEFRRQMLAQVESTKCRRARPSRPSSEEPPQPESSSTEQQESPGKRRANGKPYDPIKDAAYWERRRKNNEAAKRSRDARRAKEDEIAIRAAFLEQENLKLKYEVAALRNETAKLRCLLYSS